MAPTIDEQAAQHRIPVERVRFHRSEILMEVLGSSPLDLIVLGGTRIIRGRVLSYPRAGVINFHPGLLPDCRGSTSSAWSVLHDIPIGAGTHRASTLAICCCGVSCRSGAA